MVVYQNLFHGRVLLEVMIIFANVEAAGIGTPDNLLPRKVLYRSRLVY